MKPKPKSKVPSAVNKPFAKHPPKKATAKKPKSTKAIVAIERSPLTNSDRNPDEIFAERVQLIDGVGVKVAQETPLNESGAIVDKMVSLVAKSGLYLADAMNQLHAIHGPDFLKFLQDTGRALTTLRNYLDVGRAFPLETRQPHPALEYTHYRGLVRLEPSQRKEMIKLIEKEEIPGRKVVKIVAEKYPKPAKPQKATPAKLSTKKKPDYVMLPSEIAAITNMESAAEKLSEILGAPVEKDGDSWKQFLCKLPKARRETTADLLKLAAKLWMMIK